MTTPLRVNVAPSVLDLMGIPEPAAMSRRSVLIAFPPPYPLWKGWTPPDLPLPSRRGPRVVANPVCPRAPVLRYSPRPPLTA